MIKKIILLILISSLLILSACSSDEEVAEITFSAVIEEVNDGSWLVTTSDEVGFDQAYVSFSSEVAIAFNPQVGQNVSITIEPEIRESYPVQVTATSVSLVDSETSKSGYQKITAEEAKAIMDTENDYLLVDVRTQEEFDEGHIDGAMLIPVSEIEELAPDMLPDLDQKILLYCRSGSRSGAAARTLIDLGYTNIIDFGGIIDWPYEVVK